MPSVEAVFLHLPGRYGLTQLKAHTGPANLDHHPVSPHCLWFTPGFASATPNGRIGCMLIECRKSGLPRYIFPLLTPFGATLLSLRGTQHHHLCVRVSMLTVVTNRCLFLAEAEIFGIRRIETM
jgi:hypothetical protein